MFKEFFNLKQRSPFAIHNPVGVKLLSRLLLKFSHLNEHKFLRNSKDAPSSMLCVIVALKLKLRNRSLVLMLFIFCRKKKKLLNSLFEINVSLKNLNDKMLLDIFVFGPTNIKTLSIRRHFLIQLTSLKLPNALKDHHSAADTTL